MSKPLKRDDRRTRALKLAIEHTHAHARTIAEYANRYYMNPELWPDLRGRYESYEADMDAIKVFEEMLKTKQEAFNI